MAIEEIHKKTTVMHSDEEPIVHSYIEHDRPEYSNQYAVVYYILNIIEALLLLRLLFRMLGASTASAFTNILYAITNPFVAPFAGVFPLVRTTASVFEWSTIVAMLVYALIAYGIVQLMRIASTHRRLL